MSASKPPTDLDWLVSVDDHVIEPPNVWVDRVPAKYRDQVPHMVDSPRGPVWEYDGKQVPTSGLSVAAGKCKEEFSPDPVAFDEMRPGVYDPVARAADMDRAGILASLCFPSFPRFCGQVFWEAKDKEVAHLCVQAYNDWMMEEWCAGSGGRLIPLCLIPLWDPHAAAGEIRRNAARGCRAITFPEMPHHLALPSIHDPSGYWDPVFAAADETGTVLCMHIGSGSKMADVSPYAPRAANTVMTFSMAQISMVEWLVSGLLVRYPRLKIAYSESQIGWMPFVLERLDKCFTHTAYAELPPEITQPPSTYVKGRVFGCFFDDETGIVNRDVIGVSQMLFESDYPHQDTTWPHSETVVAKIAAQLSDEELEMVLRGNAISMLGLDPAPLHP